MDDITLTQDLPNFNTTTFSAGGEELLKLSPEGFYYKGEKVEDVHDVYNRFNDWLTAAEVNMKT